MIDVVCARQELIMPPRTTLAQAEAFGLFMMKAVISGRTGELIDLAKRICSADGGPARELRRTDVRQRPWE